MIIDYIYSVILKDFLLIKKYKLQLVMSYLSVLLYIFAIYNFSNAIEAESSSGLLFRSNTFLFLLTGYMLIDLTVTIVNIISSQINFYQTSGMFEEIMSVDNMTLFFFSSSLFVFILWLIRNSIYLFVSILFFDMNFIDNLTTNLAIFFIVNLIIISIFLIGVSLLAGAFTIVFKRGNPIIIVMVILTTVFSGSLYPTNVLPLKLDLISNYFPSSHFLMIARDVFGIGKINYESFFFNLVISPLIFY